MTTIIIITVFVIFAGLLIYLDKTKVVEDKNGNFIPDVIEEKIEEAKVRVARVAEEAKDVVEAAKEVVKQSKDVVGAAKGNARRGRKPSQNTNTKK